MKTYYCVTSSYDNHGRTRAKITSRVNADSKPETTFEMTPYADVYMDWFDSYEKAKEFANTFDT